MQYRLRNNYTTEPDKALNEILIDRGIKDVLHFRSPDSSCELNPYDLDDIEDAADLLIKHLNENSKILFIIDADCDGFTSSAILWLYIKKIKPLANLSFMIHEHKQHGLKDLIEKIENNPDYNLVICPDAASYEIDEHKRLKDLGIDCLVLDHHAQEYDINGKPITPIWSNTIVVNNQLSLNYENKSLCGAGVVYKFCEILDDFLNVQYAKDFIDLVALGEIADVMDRKIIETNYLIVEGLKHIKNEGFKTLIEAQAFSLKEKAIEPYYGLTPIDVAFYIAPLINALTRVGTIEEKENMFYCFIEPKRLVRSTKRGASLTDTETAAEHTVRVGKNAKARQDKIKEKALEAIDFKIKKNELDKNNIIFVEVDEDDNIPQELTGLVAMGIVSRYHKPCMIGRNTLKGEIAGSIRSDGNFKGLSDFKKFLEDSKLTTYVAGHAGAAGFSIKETKIDELINYSNNNLNAKDFENCYLVDYILDAEENNRDLLKEIALHPEYFGNQVEEIKIVVKNIPLDSITVMGTGKDSVKISFNDVDYIRFKDLDFIEKINTFKTRKLIIYARANLNTFAGHTSVQCFIDDYDFEVDNDRYSF